MAITMVEVERYEPSEYIKTLMALTALTISGACFGILRSLAVARYGANQFTYVFIASWLALNLKFGYRLWKKR